MGGSGALCPLYNRCIHQNKRVWGPKVVGSERVAAVDDNYPSVSEWID